MSPRCIAGCVWYMVVYKKTVIPMFCVNFYGASHIHMSGIYELLMKLGHCTGHVSEMNIEDLFPADEIFYHLVDPVIPRVFHFAEGSLAKLNHVRR